MCKPTVLALFFVAGLWFGVAAARADVTLLSNVPGVEEPYVSGDLTESDKSFSPASTFKMMIALTAFEQKVATPETELSCADNLQPQAPRENLKFPEAMRESNNDFFVQLIGRLTDEQIFDMAKRCEFGVVTGKTSTDRREWIHGGPIRVTPRQEHAFLRKLIRGKLPVPVECQKQLMTVMKWPRVHADVDVYGKTGSWEKTFWFSGLAVKSNGSVRVITVTLTADGASRVRAIQRFYDQIGRELPTPVTPVPAP